MTRRALAGRGEHLAVARAEIPFAEGDASAVIAPTQAADNSGNATRQWHHFLCALARDAARADHLAAVAACKT